MLDALRSYDALLLQMVVAALLALSLYLPMMAGQLSLASPGFYALGGYTAATMSKGVFAPPADGSFPVSALLLEMLAAGLLSAALAVVVGALALRLSGIYFALATIAFVEILRVLSLNLNITGKAIGIFGIPQPFGDKLSYMWVALPLLIGVMLFVRRLERSRVGRSLLAVREDQLAAASMGIDLTRTKVLAFTLGGTLAGVVGALDAHVLNTWNARQGTFDRSILLLAFVLIGGTRTYLGPVAGGLALTYLPEWLRSRAEAGVLPSWVSTFIDEGRFIIFGVLLTVGCIFFPRGLITPDLLKRGRRFGRRKQQPRPDVTPDASPGTPVTRGADA
ncbi:MAG TPA: branched-chain amino acid ABC transporter permease [Mycobacteriales bacterium]|jgi:branched-chain amino acid transport system permease protein|nr:branched-chain amino acid ABC transporter permease [Mycobacteriales bacterium]